MWAWIVLGIAALAACDDHNGDPYSVPTLVLPSHVTVAEHGTTTLYVRLAPRPTESWAVFFTNNDTDRVVMTPSVFDVSPDDYPARTTLLGIDDYQPDAHDRTAGFSDMVSDDAWLASDTVIAVVDWDSLNVMASDWNLDVLPNSSHDVDIRLTLPPPAPVTVMVAAFPPISVSQPTLTFDTTNYSTPQTVAISTSDTLGAFTVFLTPDSGIDEQIISVNVASDASP